MTRPSDPARERLANAVGGRSAANAPSRRRRLPNPPARRDADTDADTRPAHARRGEDKRQQGINWDLALLEYAREAVTLMGRRHPEESGSESLAALVDQAVREKITAWERKYYKGEALPPL